MASLKNSGISFTSNHPPLMITAADSKIERSILIGAGWSPKSLSSLRKLRILLVLNMSSHENKKDKISGGNVTPKLKNASFSDEYWGKYTNTESKREKASRISLIKKIPITLSIRLNKLLGAIANAGKDKAIGKTDKTESVTLVHGSLQTNSRIPVHKKKRSEPTEYAMDALYARHQPYFFVHVHHRYYHYDSEIHGVQEISCLTYPTMLFAAFSEAWPPSLNNFLRSA